MIVKYTITWPRTLIYLSVVGRNMIHLVTTNLTFTGNAYSTQNIELAQS